MKKLNITLQEANNLFALLTSLDTQDVLIKDKDGKDTVVKVPYKFNGLTRWSIARNLLLLQDNVATFNKVRDELITSISGGTNTIKPEETEKINNFTKEVNKLLAEPTETNLHTFKVEDLNIAENNISVMSLAALSVLIEA